MKRKYLKLIQKTIKRIRFRQKQARRQQVPDKYPVNEKIQAEQVRLIDDENQMIGVIPTRKAIMMAKEQNLDLVCVSPKANPPVARIMNYGNFKYQQEKIFKKQKAQQKKSDTKAIRLTPRIGKHDLDVRLKQANKFLTKGDKVNIEVILKGRERQHPEIAKEVIENFIKQLKQELEINIEQEVKKQGNKVTAIIFV